MSGKPCSCYKILNQTNYVLFILIIIRHILDAPAEKHIKTVNSKNYTDLTYYLILRRNGGFLAYILLLPCMLLAILTMVDMKFLFFFI